MPAWQDKVELVGANGETASLLLSIGDYYDEKSMEPHKNIQSCWSAAISHKPNNSTRGSVFESLIGIVLLDFGCLPFYRQGQLELVNNANFDFLLWRNSNAPITISAKTSLRERYKQADLESFAIKSVYRRSENFLVTLSSNELRVRLRKMKNGEEFSSLDQMVAADEPQFDNFIHYLSKKKFDVPETFSPIRSGLKIG